MPYIETLIAEYGLPAMFLLIFLEYACFPISSEIILPLAGMVGAGKGMPYAMLVLISSAAGLGGTTLTYGIGWLGGSPMLEKTMNRFPSMERPILASYRTFGDHGKSAVFLSRIIPLCRTYIGFVAGALKQPFGSYLVCSALGILLWNALLTGLGYYFFQYRDIFFQYFDRYKKWILIIGSLLLLIFLVHKLASGKNRLNRRENESRQE